MTLPTRYIADTVYQLKITLQESHPPIWRRIRVKDCTLDMLHEHIQTAMGSRFDAEKFDSEKATKAMRRGCRIGEAEAWRAGKPQ